MTKKTKDTILILLRAATALVLFAFVLANYGKLKSFDIDGLLGDVENFWLAFAVIMGIYILKSLVFVVPASLVYVAVGALFGGFTACAVNMAGIFLEITVTFFLGSFLRSDTVERLLLKNKNGRKLMEMNLENKSWLLFSVRFLPVFPIDLVSLFYGASGRGYTKYALLSAAGIAPRVILFTLLGVYFSALDLIVPVIVCAIPVGVAAYLIKKLIIDRRKSKEESSHLKDKQ